MAFAGPFNRTGPQGEQGPKGDPGKDGRDGKNGKDGRDGKDGITKIIREGGFGVGGSGGSSEDGTAANPFTSLNVKRVPDGIFHKIKENYENVVTRIQVIEGVLIVDGVNTIL